MADLFRHPELVSGSISSPAQQSQEWMLKRVQHDVPAAKETLSYSGVGMQYALMTIALPTAHAARGYPANFTIFAPDHEKIVKLSTETRP